MARPRIQNIRSDVAYGLSSPLLAKFCPPVITDRNPTVRDRVQEGTVWINQTLDTIYVAVKARNNQTTWASYSTQTGAFHSIAVDTGDIDVTLGDINVAAGDITVDAGNIAATAGGISAGAAITAGTNIIATDNISAGGVVGGSAVRILDNVGAGVVSTVTLTNAVDTSQSSGTLSILSKSTGDGDNAGFLKVYIGTVLAYIPYFTDIAPTP